MKKASLKMAVLIPVIAAIVAGVILMVIIVGITASSSVSNLSGELIDAKVIAYANEFKALSNEGAVDRAV